MGRKRRHTSSPASRRPLPSRSRTGPRAPRTHPSPAGNWRRLASSPPHTDRCRSAHPRCSRTGAEYSLTPRWGSATALVEEEAARVPTRRARIGRSAGSRTPCSCNSRNRSQTAPKPATAFRRTSRRAARPVEPASLHRPAFRRWGVSRSSSSSNRCWTIATTRIELRSRGGNRAETRASATYGEISSTRSGQNGRPEARPDLVRPIRGLTSPIL